MKLLNNLESSIKDLDGQDLVDFNNRKVTIKSVLANVLARGNSSEPAKMMNLALGIYNTNNEFKISNEDFQALKDTVGKDLILNNMAKLAVLHTLEEAKEIIE